MGKLQIKDKLTIEFKSLETEGYSLNEKDIVYFLVEARKMIQHDNNQHTFPAIKFYADWVLHIKKEHVPKFIEDMISNLDGKLDEFVNMEYLRQDIANFLKLHGLPMLLINEKNWKVFWKHLINALSEQPMILKVAISKFMFRAIEGEGSVIYDYEM